MAKAMVSLSRRPARRAGRICVGLLLALPLTTTGAGAQETPAGPSAPVVQAAPAPAASEPAPSLLPAAPASPAPGTVFPSGQPSTIAPLGAPATPPAPLPAAEATAPGSSSPAASAPGTEEPAPAGTATLPHDLSPWGMFMAADYVVKAVMAGLAFASLVTWTIWLAKALELAAAKLRARSSVRRLTRANGLPPLEGVETEGWKHGPVAAMVRTAAEERARSAGLPTDGVKERVAIALQRIEARAGRRMARGTGLLATIGSTAPFVGLFGTVWGIMNSFIGISQANTTNLAVVAPGIAEALLATAIGLVAAIPAVIIYNVFARSISGYRAVLSDGSAVVMQHLSRDLDRAKLAGAAPRAAYPRAAAAE